MLGVNDLKKPYIEPEIEIENITSLNNFLDTSPWENKPTDPDDFETPQEPQGPWD